LSVELEKIMTSHRWSKKSRKPDEAGQAILFVMLAMGLVLLGAVAFSVDMGNLWFHRQNAQSVADSACSAAAMDMLSGATGGGASGGFTPGSNFSCSGSPGAAPCVYAAKNMGFAPSTLTAGTPGYDVAFTFPGSLAGVPACTTGLGSPTVCDASDFTAHPYVQVNIDDRVRLSFAGLLSGSTTTDVGAQSTCGVVFSSSPIPILVLDPTRAGTLDLGGTGSVDKITIYGGPQRSLQVNSTNGGAISASGNPSVNLSQGGPNLSGSDVGVTGGPTSPNVNYNGGSTGNWVAPTPAISDPFATLPVPFKPAANGIITTGVPAGTNGCPAGAGTCKRYSPGYYPAGITVKNFTAIFDPGLYYLDGDFVGDPNSCLRPSTLVGDGSGGTVFYFNTGTLSIDSNSGSSKPNGCTASVSTNVGTGTGQLQFGVKCTAASEVPANLPTTITGNLLMGPCTGPYGDPLGTDDPIGEQHGIVFFGNRSVAAAAPAWGGGGTAALLGSLYFHYCNSPDGAGLGSNCPTTAFTDQMTLQGNPGSTSYIVGNIVTDQLQVQGTPQIFMDLNPNALYYVIKASLLQ
jgi:Putative Flp pilus-assembly TadE/G-like